MAMIAPAATANVPSAWSVTQFPNDNTNLSVIDAPVGLDRLVESMTHDSLCKMCVEPRNPWQIGSEPMPDRAHVLVTFCFNMPNSSRPYV